MTKRKQEVELDRERSMDMGHLRRETRTALELAVVAMAPSELIDRLAASAGLLEAIVELPAGSPPVMTLLPKLMVRTKAALAQWQQWQKDHLPKGNA